MRILLTGASGQLGPWLLEAIAARDAVVIPWPGRAAGGVDLRDTDHVTTFFADAAPQVVIHAAALAKPGEAYRNPQLARAVNVEATRTLASLAAERRARFIYLSTDMVFDGDRGNYRETDPATPASIYGQTKLQAEADALAIPDSLVVRLSLLFGPSKTAVSTLFDQHIAALRSGKPITVFNDEWRTPISFASAAAAIAAAARSPVTGLFHLGGPDRLSREEFAAHLADALGAPRALLHSVSRLSIETLEPRPRDTSLDSAKWCAEFPPTPRHGIADALRQMCANIPN